MKKLYTLILAIFAFTLSGKAQSLFNVEVANFQFTPAELEISVGDTVRWSNIQGVHSVNGSLVTFPNNPEEFFSGDPEVAPWTYEFVFTIPGNYAYHCDQHPNSMIGSISVVDSTLGINEAEPDYLFAFFPNPVVNQLSWKWNKDNVPNNCTMSLFSLEGKKVAEFSLTNRTSYDVSGLSKGIYSYTVREEDKQIQGGKLLIERH